MAHTISDLTIPTLGRRELFKATGAAAVGGTGAAGLAGCGGGRGDGELTHATWNVPASIAAFEKLIEEFDGGNTPVTITSTPAENPNSWLSTRLASNTAPDVLTWTYQTIGKFADGGLVDLTEYISENFGEAFLGAYWEGVHMNGGLYGIPLHTAGWGTYMNVDIMEMIGVDIPTDESEAWDWETFSEVAEETKKATGEYAFSWFHVGPETASRWLPVLYMHGGSLLDSDLAAPTIDTDEGVEAIEWTRTWFEDGLMSRENSLKASKSQTAETLFANEQVGMMIAAGFKMLGLKEKMPEDKWTVGPLFHDVEKATDVGGNALVVTTSAMDPELAAKYVEYMCDNDSMAQFCAESSFVPARTELIDQGLDWEYRPELMQTFAANSKTIPTEMVALQTMPSFSEIAALLTDQLELCWTGQQSSPETATAISDGLTTILEK